MRAGSAASRIGETDLPVDRIRATQDPARLGHQPGDLVVGRRRGVRRHRHRPRRQAARVLRPQPRLKLWPLRRARAVIHEAMRSCDIALPGLDDAKELAGLTDPDAIADFYLGLGARLVVVKLGKAGALAATRRRRERIAPLPVTAVDATGAGDCFDGAFLAEFVRHGDPFAAARFANVAAALSTLGYGAVAPLPRRAEVEAAMARLQ